MLFCSRFRFSKEGFGITGFGVQDSGSGRLRVFGLRTFPKPQAGTLRIQTDLGDT